MNKVKYSKKMPFFILCMALATAISLFAAGCCNGSTGRGTSSGAGEGGNVRTEGGVLGEGSTQFTLIVVDQEGGETQFEIHTDKETVGEALLELELIAGEESGYGLYVKTVNGITADYDKDGVYWAFYVNGEYAQTGIDSAKITEGESYSFKVE